MKRYLIMRSVKTSLLRRCMSTTRLLIAICSTSTLTLASPSFGQDYPTKPIRIVTLGFGGGNDFVSRLIAQGIAGPLGQQVIVDNHSTGVIPGEIVSKAPPDGYNLLVQGDSLYLEQLLRTTSSFPYNPLTD